MALAGLMVALASSAKPAHAQVVVGGYPAYTTYGGYGYGGGGYGYRRPFRPVRRVLRPAYYPPRVYAPRVYAPRVYAPAAPIYVAPPVPAYGAGAYYPPML